MIRETPLLVPEVSSEWIMEAVIELQNSDSGIHVTMILTRISFLGQMFDLNMSTCKIELDTASYETTIGVG